MMQEEREKLASGLSFRRISDEEPEIDAAATAATAAGGSAESPPEISAASLPRDPDETPEEGDHVEEEEEEISDEDFEFSFVSTKPDAITADEIFSNGQIRSFYPVFNRDLVFQHGGEDSDDSCSTSTRSRNSFAEKAVNLPFQKLLLEEKEVSSATSSESDELERVPAKAYCVWTPRSAPPSPDLRKKSNSTGSSLRLRLRDFVVGRSHSDGKDKFVFLAAPAEKTPKRSSDPIPKSPPREEKKGKGKGRGKVGITEMDMATAHRLFYSKGGEVGDRRRSFLPYRKDLVGFFGKVDSSARPFHI